MRGPPPWVDRHLWDAADHAGRWYRGGRVRFYAALVMLGVLTVAFSAVAVVYDQ